MISVISRIVLFVTHIMIGTVDLVIHIHLMQFVI